MNPSQAVGVSSVVDGTEVADGGEAFSTSAGRRASHQQGSRNYVS